MKKERKKLRDTKIGRWLIDKAPDILEVAGDLLPDSGAFGVVKNLIQRNDNLTPEDKEHALKLLEFEMEVEKEITSRWQSDMGSDSWLSKNARPLVLLSCVAMLFVFITLDSCRIAFNVKDAWISLYEFVLLATIGGYFGARTWEKVKRR